MLPKSHRLPRELFKGLLSEKRYFNSPHFLLRYAPSSQTRLAVSVSKKVAKSAVARNTIRRRAYAALLPFISRIPQGLYLVIAKSGAEKARGEVLSQELEKLFKEVKIH